MLTSKQKRFVRFYIKDLGNPGKAARKAGFKGSLVLVEQQANAMLENPEIRAEINAQINAARLDANMILHELQAIATTNIGDFVDISRNGEVSWNLGKAQAGAKLGVIKSIRNTRYGMEVEFYDKLAALKLLGQHEALFVTVSRTDDWRVSAIRDIQHERISYKDLLEAFGDEDLVAQLFLEAGVQLPESAMLPSGLEDAVEAEYVELDGLDENE